MINPMVIMSIVDVIAKDMHIPYGEDYGEDNIKDHILFEVKHKQ